MPAWQSILWIFQVFFARWCGIMASKKSFLRMTIIVPSAASAGFGGRRGRLKGPSAPSGMWSSTTSILLLYLLVLEVAAFQQNFGKIGKSELLLILSLGWQSCRPTILLTACSEWFNPLEFLALKMAHIFLLKSILNLLIYSPIFILCTYPVFSSYGVFESIG